MENPISWCAVPNSWVLHIRLAAAPTTHGASWPSLAPREKRQQLLQLPIDLIISKIHWFGPLHPVAAPILNSSSNYHSCFLFTLNNTVYSMNYKNILWSHFFSIDVPY